MSTSSVGKYGQTQNELLLTNLLAFYEKNDHMERLINIINGQSNISLRIIDWFVTNYAKKNFTMYSIPTKNKCSTVINDQDNVVRFKVFNNYKLELKAYSKVRFDPFSRRERIMIPYKDNTCLQTTIGQLNFFKWAIENQVLEYIENHYDEIEADMNSRNSISKKSYDDDEEAETDSKTRKRREELSISACKTIKKESVKIVVKFN
jgi:hypothetical protein